MTRVKAYLQTHARLMLELGTRYHLPADLPVGRAIEAGWLPASAAGALFALWTSPEGQLAQEVLDRAQAVGALAAALLLVERARRAARAYDQEEPAGPVP